MKIKVDTGQSAQQVSQAAGEFAPMIKAGEDRGITRTNMYEMARRNMIETFKIGRTRYVMLDSLRSLRQRADANGVIRLDPETGAKWVPLNEKAPLAGGARGTALVQADAENITPRPCPRLAQNRSA